MKWLVKFSKCCSAIVSVIGLKWSRYLWYGADKFTSLMLSLQKLSLSAVIEKVKRWLGDTKNYSETRKYFY